MIESCRVSLAQPQTEPDARWYRDPAILLLLLLPWLLLAVDSSWIFSPRGGIDPWLYFGYYQSLPQFLRTFDGLYYTTRLSVTVPGWLAYQCLPPLLANGVLHLGMYYVAVLSLYQVLHWTIGRRTAFLGALALGCHYWFLMAVGWDYPDGFGIMYLLLSMGLLARPAGTPLRPWRLVASGAAAGAVLSANLSYGILLLSVGFYLLAVTGREWDGPARAGSPSGGMLAGWRWQALLRAGCWFALGGVGLIVGLGIFSWGCSGRFLFLLPSLTWARQFTETIKTSNVWRLPLGVWLPRATWLVLPVLASVLAVVYLACKCCRPSSVRGGAVLGFQVGLLLELLFFLRLEIMGFSQLQLNYYVSLLMPAVFLSLGSQLGALVERLPRDQARRLCVAALLILLVVPGTIIACGGLSYVLLGGVGAGLFIAGMGLVWRGQTAGRLATALLVLISAANLTAWKHFQLSDCLPQTATSATRVECPSPHAGYRMVVDTLRGIHTQERSGNIWFWYDAQEPLAQVYTMCASTHLYAYRLLSTEFPRITALPWTLGQQIQPGIKIAILSTRSDVLSQANQALRAYDLQAHLLVQQVLGEPSQKFSLMVVQTAALPHREKALQACFDADGPGLLTPADDAQNAGPLPLDQWQAASANPGFQMAAGNEGWQFTTPAVPWDYVTGYAPLKAERTGVYRFELTYRLEEGDIVFGALSTDRFDWIKQAGPGTAIDESKPPCLRKSFTVRLEAGTVFRLLIANGHPDGRASSRFVVKDLRAYLVESHSPSCPANAAPPSQAHGPTEKHGTDDGHTCSAASRGTDRDQSGERAGHSQP